MATCIRLVPRNTFERIFLKPFLQCADLTLSNNVTIPSNITRDNTTAEHPHGDAPSPSQTAQAGGALGRAQNVAGYTALLMGVTGLAAMLL